MIKVARAEIKFWSSAHNRAQDNRVRVADFYNVHHAHVCALACGGLDSVHVSELRCQFTSS